MSGKWRRLSSRGTGGQSGSILVETALVLALLLPVIAGVIQTSRIFWHYNVTRAAARDAARYLSRLPPAEVDDAAKMAQARIFASQIVSNAAAAAGADIRGVVSSCAPQCKSASMTATTSGMQVTPTVNVIDASFGDIDQDADGTSYASFTSNRPIKMRYIGA